MAAQHWHILQGRAAWSGIDLRQLDLDDGLDAVYWWMIEHADEQKRAELDAQLAMPLPGQTADTDAGPWSADAEMDAFLALQAAAG